MSKYPALIRAIQQRKSLARAILVRFDFASQTDRVWAGDAPFPAHDPVSGTDETWSGVGTLGKVSAIDRLLVASKAPTFSLSGVDPQLTAYALNASAEVKGRPVRVFEQYVDLDTSQNVDVPVIMYVGLMDTLRLGASGPSQRSVTLSTVTLLYNRRRPAFAYLSASSQRRLSVGDEMLDEIPALINKDVTWPNYGS